MSSLVGVADWKIFLSPDSELPPDVSFLLADGEDSNSSRTIRAHKYFLGAVSPVFRKQFFGPMKNDRDKIEVKETTAEAFQTMIDFIYRKAGPDTFSMDSIKCPQKQFEVLQLAEYFQVWDLKTPVKKALEKLDVTGENFVHSAKVASNYKVLFEDFSLILSTRCLKFLQDTAKNPYDMASVIEDTLKNFPEVSLDILLELKRVKDEKLPGIVCKCLD